MSFCGGWFFLFFCSWGENFSLGNRRDCTRTDLTHNHTQTQLFKKKKREKERTKENITRDFFFISNEKDTKCIKNVIYSHFFFVFVFQTNLVLDQDDFCVGNLRSLCLQQFLGSRGGWLIVQRNVTDRSRRWDFIYAVKTAHKHPFLSSVDALPSYFPALCLLCFKFVSSPLMSQCFTVHDLWTCPSSSKHCRNA